MPDDQKKSWVKEHGVNYVPAPAHIEQFKYLSSWGLVDEESVPEQFKGDKSLCKILEYVFD